MKIAVQRWLTTVALMLALAAAPGALHAQGRNCGTFWTGWSDGQDPKTNPCPAHCEPSGLVQEKQYKQGQKTLVDRQYQCVVKPPQTSQAPLAAPVGLNNRRVDQGRVVSGAPGGPQNRAMRTLEGVTFAPDTGPWHTRVMISGAGIGQADRIAVLWYPGDDESQKPAGPFTATTRQRFGADQLEIEIPANSGDGTQNSSIRILAFMQGQLEPVFLGKFTLGPSKPADFKPIAIDSPALQMVGMRPIPFEITTPALQMVGMRPIPFEITTPALQMVGMRFKPVDIQTPALQMTGLKK